MLTKSRRNCGRTLSLIEFTKSMRHVIIEFMMLQLIASGVDNYYQIAIWRYNALIDHLMCECSI
mgnify:CR=1 FL=1